jgi:phage tail-like protein
MDANGARFHLIYTKDEWGSLIQVDQGEALSTLWNDPKGELRFDVEWDADEQNLRLRQLPRRDTLRRNDPASDFAAQLRRRRGAGRDRYGHWYWIGDDEQTLYFQDSKDRRTRVLWTSQPHALALDALVPPEWAYEPEVRTLLPEPPVPPVRPAGEFRPLWESPLEAAPPPAPPPVLTLRGLAVTAHHYLVVGVVEPRERRGLLIIDLYRGRPPVLMLWPDAENFASWDFAAEPDPDSGLLILNRAARRFWVLNRHFQIPTTSEMPSEAVFQPLETEPRRYEAAEWNFSGYSLPADIDPISIEHSGTGTVLILGDTATGAAVLEFGRDGANLGSVDLKSLEFDDEGVEGVPVPIRGLDFAYVECCLGDACGDADDGCLEGLEGLDADKPVRLLYLADANGKQVIVYQIKRGANGALLLSPTPNYLPMRRWGGKALVRWRSDVFYDFQQTWLPLIAFGECYYQQEAVLTTSIDFTEIDGQTFDSRITACVWHRLLLDADIPLGTQVRVRARASDNPDLLPVTGWVQQPHPYLRTGGAEIPYYEHPAVRKARLAAAKNIDADPLMRLGSWELLFQEVHGRYLQLEFTLVGSERSTPELYALRAWFPRFSYSERYLPPIYNEQPVPASFLERWLANFEGLYTNLEDMIEHLPRLLDPRSAPPETLDWLGSWMGLVLDPLWTVQQRRMFIRYAPRLYQQRGTLRGLLVALWLYLTKEPSEAQVEQFFEQAGRIALSAEARVQERFTQRHFAGEEADVLSDFVQRVITDLESRPLAAPFTGIQLAERIDGLLKALPATYLAQPLFNTTLGAFVASWLPYIRATADSTSFIRKVPQTGSFAPWGEAGGLDGEALDNLTAALLAAAIDSPARVAAFAHRFTVLVTDQIDNSDIEMIDRIIRLEKPAHTDFDLAYVWDDFVVGRSQLGIDTLLCAGIPFEPFVLGDTNIPQGYLVYSYPMDVLDRFVVDRDIIYQKPPLKPGEETWVLRTGERML